MEKASTTLSIYNKKNTKPRNRVLASLKVKQQVVKKKNLNRLLQNCKAYIASASAIVVKVNHRSHCKAQKILIFIRNC